MAHPLDGARAKVAFARRRIRELVDAIQAFGAGLKVDVASDYDPEMHVVTARFANVPELPADWSIMIGEIAHHLRLSLDHLAWQLVLANEQVPGRSTQFPVYEAAERYQKGAGAMLKGVSPTAWDRVRKHQPFQESRPSANPLAMLTEMNNVDKHRLLIVLATAFDSIGGGGLEGKWEFDPPNHVSNGAQFRVMARTPVRDGEEIFSLHVNGPTKVRAGNVKMNIQIVIGEVGPLKRQRLYDLLTTIADHVEQLLADFDAEF